MSPQLTYDSEMKKAIAGMVVDLQAAVIKSRAAEGAIDFGLGVMQGTDPEKQVKIPSSGSDVFEGISVEQWAVRKDFSTSQGLYDDKSSMAVLRKGLIWVLIDQDVVINDLVYLRHTSSLSKQGYFRKDISGGEAALVPTAVFRNTATAVTGIAQVEINLP